MILAAWALDGIAIQYAGAAIFVHVHSRSLDRMLAGAIAACGHLLIERNASITVEHGRYSGYYFATGGGRVAVADRGFGHFGGILILL
jgi:hypothetical protein